MAMAAQSSAGEPCPLSAALEAVGGKWNLIVLYWLAQETRRFAELQRLMPSISHKVLTETLRDLARHGLIDRTIVPGALPGVSYSLTAHGRSALPLVEAVRQWGHAHLARGTDGSRSSDG